MNKKVKIIVCGILSVCVGYLLLWNIYVTRTFQPYIKKLGGTWNGNMYVLQQEDYTYCVVPPVFPKVTGNLAITENLIVDEDGKAEDTASILIWLLPGNQKEIGISVETSGNNQDEYSIERVEEEFYLDGAMQLEQPVDEHIRQVYQDNYEKIQELYSKAYNKWGILK